MLFRFTIRPLVLIPVLSLLLLSPSRFVRFDEINDVNSQIYKHYKDYDLYHLATFDDEQGSFDPAGVKPVLVMRGVNAKMPLDQPST